jgi:hypothetical protein
MPSALKALLAIGVAIGAAVLTLTLVSTTVDVLAGIVALVAILVFTRAIMAFAAEPDGGRQRSRRLR